MFFYHCLKAFGFFEFRPWKYKLCAELKKYERHATAEEEAIYIPLFKKCREEKKLQELAKISSEILKLEYILTLSSIMSMRRKAIGKIFPEDSYPEHVGVQDEILPYNMSASPQDDIMSRILSVERPVFEEIWCRPYYIHEIHFAGIHIKDLQINVLEAQNGPGGLPRHGGSLKTRYRVLDWSGYMRYLMQKSAEGLPLGEFLLYALI